MFLLVPVSCLLRTGRSFRNRADLIAGSRMVTISGRPRLLLFRIGAARRWSFRLLPGFDRKRFLGRSKPNDATKPTSRRRHAVKHVSFIRLRYETVNSEIDFHHDALARPDEAGLSRTKWPRDQPAHVTAGGRIAQVERKRGERHGGRRLPSIGDRHACREPCRLPCRCCRMNFRVECLGIEVKLRVIREYSTRRQRRQEKRFHKERPSTADR